MCCQGGLGWGAGHWCGMITRITSILDPRLDVYRNLKDRELACHGGLFIAEGEFVVRRLLASDYPVESVLLARRRVDEIAPLAPTGVPVYAADDQEIHRIIGFKFHSGVIACGRRKPAPSLPALVGKESATTLVVCPETANCQNLGSMIRIAAAFGADGLLLGERCCDPFWRQAVRVSMGTIFRLPILQSQDLQADLRTLRQTHGFELAATVLDTDAEPLATASRPRRLALLFGNEAQGLDPSWISLCQRRITIPMRMGTDSLNVSVAAGIFLYHFGIEGRESGA